MRKVVLITLHYLESKRQADIHFVARAFHRTGWDVLFMTVGISRISEFRGDHRFQYPVRAEANRVKRIEDGLASFVWLRPWHPVDLRLGVLNALSMPLFRTYGAGPLGEAEGFVREADLVIFESTPGIMLFDRIRRLNPGARYVYRMSDDLRVIRTHPAVLEAEDRILPEFDLISLTGRRMLDRFGKYPQAAMHAHGIDKALFDRDVPTPYADDGRVHAVSVGGTLFDLETLLTASALMPEWSFHVFGWKHGDPGRDNIVFHGEVPFVETVPYIKHADVGLALYRYRPGAEYLADSSLKMIQYTYACLPILAPNFAVAPDRPHVCGYDAGDRESIRRALERARSFDRSTIDRERVHSWEELSAILAGDTDTAGVARSAARS